VYQDMNFINDFNYLKTILGLNIFD